MTQVTEVNVAAPEEVDTESGTTTTEEVDTETGKTATIRLGDVFAEEWTFEQATTTTGEASGPCRCASRLCATFKDVDKATNLGVNLSLFLFLFLQQGQIIKNFRDPDSMAGLRWNGDGAGAMADLIMATFFCSIGETGQARVNIFGTISNLIPVIQMFAYRPPGSPNPALVPALPFFVYVTLVVVGLIIVLMRFGGRWESTFARWVKITTVLGGALVAYTLTYEIQCDLGFTEKRPVVTKATNVAAMLAGGAVLLCMVLLKKTGDSTGPWLATLLYIYMPLPQIWENFVHPASAADLSTSFIYFYVTANGLGLARAMYTRCWMWVIGAGWACMLGVVMSAGVVMASARLPEPFLTPLNLCALIGFNAAFIVYGALLYFSLGRKKQPVDEPQHQDPTHAGADAPTAVQTPPV
jgi:hypothetical protein